MTWEQICYLIKYYVLKSSISFQTAIICPLRHYSRKLGPGVALGPVHKYLFSIPSWADWAVSSLFPRVCFCSNIAASRVLTQSRARLRGKWSLRDVFLETPTIHRIAWIVKTLGWISWLIHSFPPSPRASSLTLLSITPNPKQPDTNQRSSHEESKSYHRKTWLVLVSPFSPPQQ